MSDLGFVEGGSEVFVGGAALPPTFELSLQEAIEKWFADQNQPGAKNNNDDGDSPKYHEIQVEGVSIRFQTYNETPSVHSSSPTTSQGDNEDKQRDEFWWIELFPIVGTAKILKNTVESFQDPYASKGERLARVAETVVSLGFDVLMLPALKASLKLLMTSKVVAKEFLKQGPRTLIRMAVKNWIRDGTFLLVRVLCVKGTLFTVYVCAEMLEKWQKNREAEMCRF